MSKQCDKYLNLMILGTLLLSVVLPSDVFASTTGSFAWESTATKITNSLTGPIAYALSILGIFACGCVIAFADLQHGAKRFVQVCLGLSIALGAAQIVVGFLGFSGAVI